LCLEGDDGLGQVHNGTVGADRSPDYIVGILKVDNDGLGGRVGFVVDLAHANVLVRLERLRLSANPRGLGCLCRPHTQFCHDIDAGWSLC